MIKKGTVYLILIVLAGIKPAIAQVGGWDPEMEKKTRETIEAFKDKNQKFEVFFEEAYGYAVFPSIGKGAIGIGGAHGKGLVFEQSAIIGETSMTQVSIGFQWGGQAYSEVVFFKDKDASDNFKYGKLKFAGQVSAVAVTAGASADIAYKDGVAVFTMVKGGLMYEASVGGQKFKYTPAKEDK